MKPGKGKKLLDALASPLTLVVGAAGAATFFVSGLWWVVPLTVGVAGVVSATQYRGPEQRRVLPPPYAAHQAALLASIDRVAAAVAGSSDTIRTSLAGVPGKLAEMRDVVTRLLERQARIAAFLKESSSASAERELGQLRASESAARTDDARQKFANAAANKQSEIDARADLAASGERIAAELAEIQSALSSTLSKIVALEDQHDEAVQQNGQGIDGSLGDVLTTVNALEQALGDTFDPDGARRRHG